MKMPAASPLSDAAQNPKLPPANKQAQNTRQRLIMQAIVQQWSQPWRSAGSQNRALFQPYCPRRPVLREGA